ncbi:MAG: hypothetical protein OSA78_05470 [Flavobacteriales bacterium]|nr:hypothetical protein [Flavobacteriales bacterium]
MMNWNFKGQEGVRSGLLCTAMVAFALTMGCNRAPIEWQVDLALPLIDDVIEWNDVFSDTSVFSTDGTTASLVYYGALSSWDIESLTQLPDTLITKDLSPDFIGGPFQVPPGAILLDTEEDIVFQGIDQSFRFIRLESGTISYSVESSTNGYVEIQYELPSVTIGGELLNLNVLLSPSVAGVIQSETGTIDLTGAEIDLTGVSGTEINRIATRLTIGTPAYIPDTAQVYGDDSIRVSMHFQDMLVRQVTGYFGKEVVDFNVDQTVFDPEVFLGGFIDVEPTRARIKFQNTIGADLRLTLDALSLDGIILEHPELGVPQLISRADWQGDEVIPAVWELDLLETSPSFFELMGYLPQFVSSLGSAALNPLGDVSGGNDFFDVQVPPELILDLEWPLNTQIENLRLRQVRDMEPISLPDFNGDLVLEVTNGFPVHWGLQWILTFDNTSLEPLVFSGESLAFQVGTTLEEPIEYRIPISSEMLLSGGQLEITGSMQTDGAVVFSGNERMRIQVRIEGTHQVVIK